MILAKKSGDPPQEVPWGSPDDFRLDNIAGSHGMKKVYIDPTNNLYDHGEFETDFYDS